jgi:hypothetical protein
MDAFVFALEFLRHWSCLLTFKHARRSASLQSEIYSLSDDVFNSSTSICTWLPVGTAEHNKHPYSLSVKSDCSTILCTMHIRLL